MYALKKLLLIMALLFSSSISLFFESCVLCVFLRLTLLILILIPQSWEKVSLGLEISGLLVSLLLSFIQNPLFCESGCNTLLSILPLTSLCVFFFLLILRLTKAPSKSTAVLKDTPLPPSKENREED